jgi:hypothetical protein
MTYYNFIVGILKVEFGRIEPAFDDLFIDLVSFPFAQHHEASLTKVPQPATPSVSPHSFNSDSARLAVPRETA